MKNPILKNKDRLRELATLFFKLGSLAFGGPVAHIAMMEEEVVKRRQWMTSEEFLDLLGATNLIPGPNSTEMAIHIGFRQAGGLGLIVAGVCFILPAMILTTIIAWAYVRFGQIPEVGHFFYGIKPVIIAIVLQALWRLTRTALKTKKLIFLALLAMLSIFLGIHELAVLFGTGFLILLWSTLKQNHKTLPMAPSILFFPSFSLFGIPGLFGAIGASATPFSLGAMFFFFVKVGSILFGSGYVLLAFLRADLVERFHWLTESQLVDAIAVGQITPGPVFTTATFIGYLLSGTSGALLATVGIFLPAFFFVAISAPVLPRLKSSRSFSAFLEGVNVASLALMTVVTLQLAQVSFVDLFTLVLGFVSLILLFRYALNSIWLILGGAILGWGYSALNGLL